MTCWELYLDLVREKCLKCRGVLEFITARLFTGKHLACKTQNDLINVVNY